MSSPAFEIVFPAVTLTVEQLWPDGDAPGIPSAHDVAEKLRRDGLSALSLVPQRATINRVWEGEPMDAAEVELGN